MCRTKFNGQWCIYEQPKRKGSAKIEQYTDQLCQNHAGYNTKPSTFFGAVILFCT